MPGRSLKLLALAVFTCLIGSAVPATAAAATGTRSSHRAASPRGAGLHRDTLLVRFGDGTADATMASTLAAVGATAVGRLDQLNTLVVAPSAGRTRGEVQRALAANRAVRSVETDGVARLTLTPNDTFWSQEWYATKVRTDRAWGITIGTGGPVIAVLDSGVGTAQPDLLGRVLPGYDFVNGDNNAADDLGHGTKVSGIIAGLGMNALGVAGMCWDCRILPVKVADSAGNVVWSNAAAGLLWATDNGAKVVNMSFGKSTANSTMAAAVDYARSHGVVVIASAGNDGNTAKIYPGAFPGVLSVAGTTATDTLYSWSSRGTWVRLAAPGCTYTTFKGSNWGSFCGTSASAPIVAGLAGLILAYKPDATQAQIEDAIVSTAVTTTANIGGGRVDAYAAVHKFEPPKGKGGGRKP